MPKALTCYFCTVKKRLFSFFIFILGILLISAGLPRRVVKAYEALAMYDYFKAKELFYKSLKKDSVAAGYGLSVIYSRDDNPFTQIDSAHKFIHIAEQNWALVDGKVRIDYAALGVDSLAILSQAFSVDSLAYSRAAAADEIESWNEFIVEYDNGAFRAKAIENRNEMIFRFAKADHTAAAYADFLKKYPDASQVAEAKKLYDLRNFEERTAERTLSSYQLFIDSFPDSPYVPDAEERIYAKATSGGKPKDYLQFVNAFPQNSYVDMAWRRIYASEVKELNAASIAEFTLDYPDYPFMAELKLEFELAITRFYPVTDGYYWGFINDIGQVAIDLKYEWVENFSDGIAMVGVGNEVTYIDKEGEELSEHRYADGFSFNRGFAVVEKDDYTGVINRLGEYIIEPIYEDVGENSEGLFYAKRAGYFGYINELGEIAIPFVYTDALDFHQGVAVVADSSGRKGMINETGKIIAAFEYSWIESFRSVELPVRFRQEGKFGLMNRAGLILTDTLYQALAEFSEGMALAAGEGQYGFLNAKGDTVIDFSYSYSPEALVNSKFENGIAKVFQKDKVGLIDSIGVKVFPAIFEDVGSFSGKLIPVKKRGKWGYSDLDVNLAIPYRYSFASGFRQSHAIVAQEGKFGVIDTAGAVRIPLQFTSVEWMDTLLLVQDSAFGIISLSQDTLVPLRYMEVKRMDEKVLQLKLFGGSYDYYNLREKQYLRREETPVE